jgi:uncharacterized protein (DUF2236 family)
MTDAARPFVRPPQGGVTWQLAGERLGLLAWPRAILLQIAHPLIAAGVAAHSRFRASPWAPYVRLHATTKAMRRLTFGTDEEARAALDGILRIHDRVHGALGATVGGHRAGTSYTAHDPTLLLWVHATLIDSYVRVLADVLGPFGQMDFDRYCAESAGLAIALGARDADVPRRWDALQRYMEAEFTGGRIAVGAEARELARAVLHPSLGWMLWPIPRAVELITLGSLPEALRAQYGFVWSDAYEQRRQRALAFIRGARTRLPDRLARWPEAR